MPDTDEARVPDRRRGRAVRRVRVPVVDVELGVGRGGQAREAHPRHDLPVRVFLPLVGQQLRLRREHDVEAVGARHGLDVRIGEHHEDREGGQRSRDLRRVDGDQLPPRVRGVDPVRLPGVQKARIRKACVREPGVQKAGVQLEPGVLDSGVQPEPGVGDSGVRARILDAGVRKAPSTVFDARIRHVSRIGEAGVDRSILLRPDVFRQHARIVVDAGSGRGIEDAPRCKKDCERDSHGIMRPQDPGGCTASLYVRVPASMSERGAPRR